MVPGSTLMYGSSFCIVTRRPRALRSRPSEEAVSPFPSELATPPVTKMCLATGGQGTKRRAARGARCSSAGSRAAAEVVEPPQRRRRVDHPAEAHPLADHVQRHEGDEHGDPGGLAAGEHDAQADGGPDGVGTGVA